MTAHFVPVRGMILIKEDDNLDGVYVRASDFKSMKAERDLLLETFKSISGLLLTTSKQLLEKHIDEFTARYNPGTGAPGQGDHSLEAGG